MRMLRFEGATMRDALAKVKAELGDRAVIFSTRQVRRGLLGTAVEVSAAIEDDARDPRDGILRAGSDALPSGPTTWARGPAWARPGAGEPAPAPQELERLIGPLKSELRSLRAMVRAAGADSRREAEIKTELAALRRLVEDLRADASAPATTTAADADLDDAAAVAALTAESRGRALLFVGPTGAGKTTTIAKLAATAALAQGAHVRLITLDTYRVGGLDQIQTFADLIGIPLAVAESPAALAAHLELADAPGSLTLIDTAGRGPRDTSSIDELAAALPGLPPIEVHLVVPAAAAAAAIDELAARYRALRPARLLFTKLDEGDRAGELVRAPARTGLPVTWITTGQAVPRTSKSPRPDACSSSRAPACRRPPGAPAPLPRAAAALHREAP